MEDTPKTQEEVAQMIKAARDSVWVIEDTLAQLQAGKTANNQRKGDIERNVGHLGVVVADKDVMSSGQDISDLNAAIAMGNAKLAENIWLTE